MEFKNWFDVMSHILYFSRPQVQQRTMQEMALWWKMTYKHGGSWFNHFVYLWSNKVPGNPNDPSVHMNCSFPFSQNISWFWIHSSGRAGLGLWCDCTYTRYQWNCAAGEYKVCVKNGWKKYLSAEEEFLLSSHIRS